MEGKGTQLWTLSAHAQGYERTRNLLSGRLANSLTPEQINAHTLTQSLDALKAESALTVIHDGADIRKPYSKALPHLTKVKALDGDWINGYNSFNSVVISDVNKQIHLLRCSPYSYADPHFNRPTGAGFSEREIIEEQIRATDQALKERFPGLDLWHLLDRKHDDEATFEFINGLKSNFIIRLKANRNSNEIKQNEKDKSIPVKLGQALLDSSQSQLLDRFVWKNKVFQQATLTTTYGKLTLAEKTYCVCRIQVLDRKGEPIFKEPMLLLTNAAVSNHAQVFEIYQRYLKRSKIEGVFKFLKDRLGWEKFQIRDFMAIQNILVLCFFVAEYFYENQPLLCQDTSVAIICELAKSKGKITKHFYLEGLVIVANYLLFQQYVKEHNLSQSEVDQIVDLIR